MSTVHPTRFTDKVALITGAGTGIGAAIAKRFASEGAAVAICGRRRELLAAKAEELRILGYEILDIPGDVSTDAAEIVRAAVNHFGGLDILVNNAAISVGLSVSEMTLDAWRQVMATNMDGAFALIVHAGPYLTASRGNILHISSIGAVAGNFDDLAYVASKAGLEGISRKLALELAELGVRSNVIRPGLIMTEAFDKMPHDFFDSQIPMIPLGQIGRPEDVAAAAAFLCSEEAGFITGAVLSVDGGESAR